MRADDTVLQIVGAILSLLALVGVYFIASEVALVARGLLAGRRRPSGKTAHPATQSAREEIVADTLTEHSGEGDSQPAKD